MAKAILPEAAMKQAYAWNCPKCGTRNFCESVPIEVSEEDRENQPEEFRDALTGDWLTYPDEVDCSKCGREYEVKPPEERDRTGFDPQHSG